MNQEKWKKLKKSIWTCLVLLTLITAIAAGVYWGPKSGLLVITGALCLAAGFYITELLIGIFVGLKKANPAAIAVLMLAKLGWWGFLIYMSTRTNPGDRAPIALGMGIFLLSLILGSILQHGMPKISDVNGPVEP